MQRSLPKTLVIDCCTDDLGKAAVFWSAALGRPIVDHANERDHKYTKLQTAASEPAILLQRVKHVRGVHVDIQTDDLEAEVSRLERLGASRIGFVCEKSWTMAAPCGQFFCVVKASCRGFGPHLDQRA